MGKSPNQLIRDYLQTVAGGDDAERSIDEFKRLWGQGHSRGHRSAPPTWLFFLGGLILRTAKQARCSVLLSDDMQEAREVDGIR